MKIDVTNLIDHYLVKGEISKRFKNPWIRAFLTYLQNHPQASAEEISRDLFADNGIARRNAVQNLLYFFECQKMLQRENGKWELTEEGIRATEDEMLWQTINGTFLVSFLNLDENHFFVLQVEEKPDSWYDDGYQDLEKMIVGPENWKLFSPDIRIEKLARDVRPTSATYKFDADFNLAKRSLEINGIPEKMKSEIHAEFELTEDEIRSLDGLLSGNDAWMD